MGDAEVTDFKARIMSLLNLTLAQAQVAADKPLEIIETAPPFAPRHYTPQWGEWRVIREREIEGATQIVVARELLKELPNETPPKIR